VDQAGLGKLGDGDGGATDGAGGDRDDASAGAAPRRRPAAGRRGIRFGSRGCLRAVSASRFSVSARWRARRSRSDPTLPGGVDREDVSSGSGGAVRWAAPGQSGTASGGRARRRPSVALPGRSFSTRVSKAILVAARRWAERERGLASASSGPGAHRAPGQEFGLGIVAADADRQLRRTDRSRSPSRPGTASPAGLERVEGDRGEAGRRAAGRPRPAAAPHPIGRARR